MIFLRTFHKKIKILKSFILLFYNIKYIINKNIMIKGLYYKSRRNFNYLKNIRGLRKFCKNLSIFFFFKKIIYKLKKNLTFFFFFNLYRFKFIALKSFYKIIWTNYIFYSSILRFKSVYNINKGFKINRKQRLYYLEFLNKFFKKKNKIKKYFFCQKISLILFFILKNKFFKYLILFFFKFKIYICSIFKSINQKILNQKGKVILFFSKKLNLFLLQKICKNQYKLFNYFLYLKKKFSKQILKYKNYNVIDLNNNKNLFIHNLKLKIIYSRFFFRKCILRFFL